MNSYYVCHSEVFRPAAGEFKSVGSVWVMMMRRNSPTNDAVFHIAAGRDRVGTSPACRRGLSAAAEVIIDAARDDGSLGRLVNDDHINPNCKMKRLIVEGRPHLCLFALRDVTPGEEITYDYGDADCPWRSEVTESGMEADNNHLESEGASGDDQHRTKHSQHKSAFGVQVSKLLKFKRVHR
ncbi:hypothetical protein MHYP_G00329080 [Metynnis hypsauchen]